MILSLFNRRRIWIFLRKLLFIAFMVLLILNGYQYLTKPVWHGIVPGWTRLPIAFIILGKPDETINQGGYQIHRYIKREQLDNWKEIQLWSDRKGWNSVVRAIYRSSQVYDRKLMSDIGQENMAKDIELLSEIVIKYGRAEKVTWSNVCGRYLIWPEKGISVAAEHLSLRRYGWDVLVNSILLFSPMSLDEYLATDWPWLGYGAEISSYRTCAEGDSPDPFPEDPYDWEQIPTLEP